MKKRIFSIFLAIVMVIGLAMPMLAHESWYHYPEDGAYFLRGWAGDDRGTLPTLRVSLVSTEPITFTHCMQNGEAIHLPLGTQLVIELFQVPATATMHLERATVELGMFSGNATRNEEIEDGWLFSWYEIEYDYTTLLNYNRDDGGMITGSNRIVHVFDTPGDFIVRHSLSTWVRGSNAMEGLGSPPRISVGGGGSIPFPQNGWVQLDEYPTTDTTPNLNTASTWAHDGISQAFELGLIPHALQNNYTANTTRAEFSALAVYLYETVTGRTIVGRTQFNDTTDINVQKMGYLGVVTGVGGGNFAPNDTITREQAAVMIARLANAIGQPLPLASATFADNAYISSWAIEGVGQVQGVGIMGGVGNNMFAPRGMYTREQSIITMLRLLD